MYFYLLFLIALFARSFDFPNIPGGINCDEAYAGYEAYSLLMSSFDSWGKKMPVYFITGGGGTNVLYSYISIPFITLFGLKTWVIRLPQLILGMLSVYCFYKLVKLIYDKTTACIGLFIIAIMPWHIMLSRWGFHGNIAPAFCLFAFCFYCKSIKKISYIWLSMLCWGLGCYTYDPAIGFILGAVLILTVYLILYAKTKNKTFWHNLIGSCILFAILLTPLILLWLINNYGLEEINNQYFSIPKLPGWRGKEINITDFGSNFLILFKLLGTQTDNMIWNTINRFGLFYYISTPFIIFGIITLGKQGMLELKNKIFSYKLCICLLFIWGILYASLFPAHSSNRINYLFFIITLFITAGISFFAKYKKFFICIILAYTALFIDFELIYFKKYNILAKNNFSIGFKEALQEADKHHTLTNKEIHILQQESEASKILFYNKIDNLKYKDTVKWKNYPSSYLFAKSFLHYSFFTPYDDLKITKGIIYIAPKYTRPYFINELKKDFQIKIFEQYMVVF